MNQGELRTVIASTASICTILQFLTGTLVCLKIVKNKSTGDLSCFPYVTGCLSTSLWLRYGFFLEDSSLILVNTIGASLFLSYILTFLIYSFKKTIVIRQTLGCACALAVILCYVQSLEDYDKAKTILGVTCCIITIIFFAAPLASLFHVIRMKSTESLPFALILAGFIVSVQWLIYGILLEDKFIQIPNFLGCVLSGFQLALFCVYPKSSGYSMVKNENI